MFQASLSVLLAVSLFVSQLDLPHTWVQDTIPNILVQTETWLTDSVSDKDIEICG
jgi:hypothetical protein